MLNEQTAAKMHRMKLSGMAQMFKELMEKPQRSDLTHEEFIPFFALEDDCIQNNRNNKVIYSLMQCSRNTIRKTLNIRGFLRCNTLNLFIKIVT